MLDITLLKINCFSDAGVTISEGMVDSVFSKFKTEPVYKTVIIVTSRSIMILIIELNMIGSSIRYNIIDQTMTTRRDTRITLYLFSLNNSPLTNLSNIIIPLLNL